MYYDYSEAIKFIPSHRILAINRGEKEEFIKVKLEKPEEKILLYIEKDVIKGETQFFNMLRNTILDSFKRLIEPSIDREIRSDLTQKAEEKAIKVFGQNAKQLLLGAPIKGKTVMGFDPAYRTGCKIAVIDETGKVLDYTTVYPTEPQNDVVGAKKELLKLIDKYKINMIAIGNGTASRESEMFVSDMIKEASCDVHYVIVSEAGASVYSASKLATEEYPDINVSIRGAISIARRLQDPLAELVKIDPKAIGVGQYQHDVNQKNLAESLTGVVEDSVNKVGVDVNTATPSLLSYVSGINNTIAKNIVKYRDENGNTAEATAEISGRNNNVVNITIENPEKNGKYHIKLIKYKMGTTTPVAGAKFHLIGGNIGSVTFSRVVDGHPTGPLSRENYEEITTGTIRCPSEGNCADGAGFKELRDTGKPISHGSTEDCIGRRKDKDCRR